MRRLLRFCLILAASHAPGQTIAIPPSPPATSQAPLPTPTITSRTDLVVVDLVVTDRAGNSVHGLQSSDFTITEDAVPEPIRSFDEHVAPTEPPPHPEPPLNLPPGVFTNYEPVPHTAALNVLLVDTLNTPLLDQSFVRSELLSYIRHASPADQIAIFGLTTHLVYLQGFTSDPALLRAAVDQKSIHSSQLLSNPARGGGGDAMSRTLELGHDPEIAATVARVREFEAREQGFQVQLRAHYTLGAINALARYLAGLPGRKNLIWFSGSFPLSILPNPSLADPFGAAADLSADLRDTTSLLNSAQIAIYPIDARGLFNSSAYDPSERGSTNPLDFNRDFTRDSERRIEEFSTMRSMAEQTGGRAFVNNNGFRQAVTTVLRTGANFYTLTYTPSNHNRDGRFRRISVHLQGQLAQNNLTLSYRRGYFAFPPDNPAAVSNSKAPVSTGKAAPVIGNPTVLRSAMQRGAPSTTGIIFKARILPVAPASAPADPAPNPANRVNSDPKYAHAPWRRYTVDLVASPGQLMKLAHDGSYSGLAEFVTYCFDDDGALITSATETASLKLSPGDARQAAGTGVTCSRPSASPTAAAITSALACTT